MPVLIVHAFESVEVEEDDRQRDAVALAALDLASDVQVQVARVEELGEIVGDRELLRLLEQDRVLDGNGARLHERQQDVEVAVGEPAAQLVDDLDDTDRAAARNERGAKDRTGLELR